MEDQTRLPKPELDLPLPEKELPAHSGPASQGVPLRSYGIKFPFPKYVFLGAVFVLLLIIVGGAYFLGKNSNNNSVPIPSPAPVVYQPTPDPTADWETFTGIDFTFMYPKDWKKIADNIISEKDFIPGEQDTTKIYNIIEIQKYDTQMYVGYTNQQWFEKIYNLKQSDTLEDQRQSIERLGISGETTTGEKYVAFEVTTPSTKSSTGDGLRQTKVYILKGQTIYQLTLDLSDNKGAQVFEKVLSTFKFSASKFTQ